MLIEDAWQRRGAGSALVAAVVGRARELGLPGLVADVLADNYFVLPWLARTGAIRTTFAYSGYRVLVGLGQAHYRRRCSRRCPRPGLTTCSATKLSRASPWRNAKTSCEKPATGAWSGKEWQCGSSRSGKRAYAGGSLQHRANKRFPPPAPGWLLSRAIPSATTIIEQKVRGRHRAGGHADEGGGASDVHFGLPPERALTAPHCRFTADETGLSMGAG